MKKISFLIIVISMFITISGCSNHLESKKVVSTKVTPTQKTENNAVSVYSNPIDAYYLPKIENSSCEAERRGWQDDYYYVWNNEFNKVVQMMKSKCSYQKDKNALEAYKESICDSMDKASNVLVTDWLDDYKLPPNSSDRGTWGNGTRSGLNEIKASILREASMILIPYCDKYAYPKDFKSIITPE